MGKVTFAGRRDGWPRYGNPTVDPTISTGTGTGAPFAFNLKRMREIVWRVREWTVDVSGITLEKTSGIKYLTNFATGTQTSFIATARKPGYYDAIPDGHEHRLVYGGSNANIRTWLEEPIPEVTVTYPGGGTPFSAQLLCEFDINYYIFARVGDSFFPRVTFGISGGGFAAYAGSSGLFSYAPSPGILRLVIGDEEWEEPLRVPVGGYTTSGTVTVTAKKWWTYGGLYDENTGALT